MIEAEFIERLTKVEEKVKSNIHQMNEFKPVMEEIHTMSKTMVELISEVRHTNDNVTVLNNKVQKIDGKVEEIEQRPAKRYSDTIEKFFTAVISAVGTAAAAGILYLLTKGVI